jgi:predicted unusual protein kinase regulating ubiquinone biosynthesis (AarF/ABC1/UbiB family)
MRRTTGRLLLHSVLTHMLVYREFHGDLHPGNVLITPQSALYFVDWGNTVDLNGIWKPALQYIQAVLSGRQEAITEAILGMCADPHLSASHKSELLSTIKKTLEEASISPLGIDFALTLYREGAEGLSKRVELAINLATAISRQGITMRGEYMHLTRSVSAMLGSLLGLYKDLPRTDLMQDLCQILLLFPSQLGLEYLSGQRAKLIGRIAGGLPLPGRLAGNAADTALEASYSGA